jgi:hypothetical protein
MINLDQTAPVGDIPLTTFSGTVKFYRSVFGNSIGALTMREAFPGFSPDPNDDDAAKRERAKAMGRHVDHLFIVKDAPLPRRFAGDMTLSRGCYYSVCNDELGNDQGTLGRELAAYRYPKMGGHVLVHDLVMPDHAEELRKYCDAPTGFAIEFRSTAKGPNPVVEKLRDARLIAVEDPTKPVVIFMPLAIKQFEVPRVLDLRQLEAQRWLTRFLPKGNEIFRKPMATQLSTFPDMLPSLLAPARGGTDFTNGIGVLLRNSGVSGLIFPSARSNVKCEFRDGHLNNFLGWNFVDYRNADRCHSDAFTDFSPWEPRIPEGMGCELAPNDSPFAHSWRIHGLEEWHDLEAQNMLLDAQKDE